jgi:hypothetical protein
MDHQSDNGATMDHVSKTKLQTSLIEIINVSEEYADAVCHQKLISELSKGLIDADKLDTLLKKDIRDEKRIPSKHRDLFDKRTLYRSRSSLTRKHG